MFIFQLGFSFLDLSMRRTNTASGSLENLKSHNEELYPHYHLVMSRRRLSVDKEKPRKGKVITNEAFTALPTIRDIDEDNANSASVELRYLLFEF